MVATVSLNAQSVVVITGSSRGLGLEFVRQLLDTTESHVVATARDPQKADALTALAKQQPDRLKLVALDTGDESSIKAAAKEVASLYSGVDLLINNAGIDEGVETPVLELDAATYEKILKVNVNPVGNKWIAYNASKAALNMQSSVFANELKKDKFCVVSLEPGWVDTDMGGGNARKMGMEKAPTDAHHSISTMLKTIQQLSIKDSGEFLTIDGNKMDY
ncbi:hypothetical protein WJX79_010100 [Trebouxia sp. C0005]